MKLALIADIHGNLSALDAVMDDISKRRVDKIICLGDIVGKGPDTKETIDICRDKCDVITIGNWEDGTYYSRNELKNGNTKGITERLRWLIDDIGEERMEYLGALPHFTELELSGKLVRMFHAHPHNFNRYFSDSPVEQRLELFEAPEGSSVDVKSDVAIYADIHTAYMQTLKRKTLLNVGSVGNPLDMAMASYVILNGNETTQSFDVQFIRVEYDIERTIAEAKRRNIPDLDGYITELREAKYFKRGS